jgi:hypothetical protein
VYPCRIAVSSELIITSAYTSMTWNGLGESPAVSQDRLEFVRFLSQHQRGMLVRKANLGPAGVMLLDPNDLFGVDVDVFLLDVRYLNQNAHVNSSQFVDSEQCFF